MPRIPVYALGRKVAFALTVVLLTVGHAHAEKLSLAVPVLRGGKPLPGVPVTIRTFDPQTGRLKAPQRLRTDEKGHIVAQVEIASEAEREAIPRAARPLPNDYLVIDVPDAPLVVVELQALRPKAFRGLSQIDIETGVILRGKVFKGKQGTQGSDVALTHVNGIPLNDSKRGVTTPQLKGQTQEDGSFALRPLQIEGNQNAEENGYFLASAMASLKSDGRLLRAGSGELQLQDATAPANPQYAARLTLSDTWTVRGKVVDSLKEAPIAGARVEALAYSIWPIEPAISNAEGEWELMGIPPQFQFHVVTTHPKFGVAWKQVGEYVGSIGAEERKPKVFADVTLPMRPLTSVNGLVVDEATGKVPVLLLGQEQWLKPTVGAVYEEGLSDYTQTRGYTKANLDASGVFNLPVAVGDNVIWPHVPFYEPVERGMYFEAGPQGAKDLEVKVRREPYFVVRFVANNPDELKKVYVRDITNNPQGVGHGSDSLPPSGYWSSRASKWGQEMKVRIHYGEGKTFETTFTAELKNFPQIVQVPAP